MNRIGRSSLVYVGALVLFASPLWAPPNPDIGLGSGGGWSLAGSPPASGGAGEFGSQLFGTVSTFTLQLAGQSGPIDVTQVTLSARDSSVTISGSSGSEISWVVDGEAIEPCSSCDPTTMPSGIQTINGGGGVTFSYLPVGASTPSTAPIQNFQGIAIDFQ